VYTVVYQRPKGRVFFDFFSHVFPWRIMQRFFVLLGLTLVLVGCQQVALEATKRFNVRLEPEALTIARGGEGTTTVTITPVTGFDLGSEEAVVTLIGPPAGVTAGTLTIPAGISSRPLTLQVAATATPATDQEITIEVVKDGRGVDAKLKLTVE
jgi:hypothetical protein